MRDEDKSKEQLIAELIELRKRINDPEPLKPYPMEEELRKHRDSLEDIINERTAQLQTALAQLQQEVAGHNLAEQALRKSENKFRLLFERSADAIILYNREKHFDCNQAAIEMFRCYDKKSLLAVELSKLSPERQPDGQLSCEKMAQVVKLAYDKGTHRFEWVHRRLDGEDFYAQVTLTTVPLGDREIFYATCQDITARKQAEKELYKREQFLNSIFESIQDSLTVIDTEFNIIRINNKSEQLYSHEMPLVGKKCYKAYYGEDEICAGCPGLKTITDCEPSYAIVPMKDRDGNNQGWFNHYCYPFIDMVTGKLLGVIIYAQDITEKMRVEQEMARIERLNLVGQMAAGIGHEIRNPMTTVKGFLQLLGDKIEFDRHKEYFKLMLSELDRANVIITEYLSLARNKPVNLVELNINTILAALQPLLMAEAMNAGINLSVKQGDVPELPLNENEIRQLILNLVKNGFEAMENGGILVVQTYVDNGDVVLSVQDRGQGIDPELVEKLGTPFLTTKDKGTGLGLAVCYGIAARHNAFINFETGPAGTIFFVRFKPPGSDDDTMLK